ncbi:MAG: phosphomannomutase/phosphoglucomutase [Cyanobacteria bacterium SIG30]|nr:phosphomannomutase/phosphoglucomutase [Cyanobacteria bacterium SIG30]
MQETLNTSAFGKNDIRGIYPTEVNAKLFYYAAKGYAKWAKEQFQKANIVKNYNEMLFAVCMDARLHSPELKKAVIEGLSSIGANVLDLGLAPTPLGYYSEFAQIDESALNGNKINGALIITASHNPSEYNGLKMTFNKTCLIEEDIKEVKKYTEEAFNNREQQGYRSLLSGSIIEYNLIPTYIEKISNNFDKIGNGIKVVVDSANATAGVVAPDLYRELGCEVIELFSKPDGNFPNHHPNPSDEKTLDAIKKEVVEAKADFGLAFDGDSDRLGVIDSSGNKIAGDLLILIYALDLIDSLKGRGEKPVVVSEVKCSQALYDTINAKGGEAIMWKTGHSYIKSKMKEKHALLAGEMSGHLFFKDRYYGFDDAMYAGCRIIEIVAKNKKQNPNFKIEDLIDEYRKMFYAMEIRLPCPNELKKPVLKALEEKMTEELFGSKIKEIVTIDGMRLIFEDGFALIRQSNTEPVFTMGFEATTKEKCEKYYNTLVDETQKLVDSLKVSDKI